MLQIQTFQPPGIAETTHLHGGKKTNQRSQKLVLVLRWCFGRQQCCSSRVLANTFRTCPHFEAEMCAAVVFFLQPFVSFCMVVYRVVSCLDFVRRLTGWCWFPIMVSTSWYGEYLSFYRVQGSTCFKISSMNSISSCKFLEPSKQLARASGSDRKTFLIDLDCNDRNQHRQLLPGSVCLEHLSLCNWIYSLCLEAFCLGIKWPI